MKRFSRCSQTSCRMPLWPPARVPWPPRLSGLTQTAWKDSPLGLPAVQDGDLGLRTGSTQKKPHRAGNPREIRHSADSGDPLWHILSLLQSFAHLTVACMQVSSVTCMSKFPNYCLRFFFACFPSSGQPSMVCQRKFKFNSFSFFFLATTGAKERECWFYQQPWLVEVCWPRTRPKAAVISSWQGRYPRRWKPPSQFPSLNIRYSKNKTSYLHINNIYAP